MVTTFKGTPAEIGRAYGEKFKEKILKNIAVLIDPHRESLKGKPGFEAWKKRHEANIAAEFPWYIGEMAALAEAVGVDYDTILMLNLRAWQYDLYSGLPLEDCSSFILRLRGGADVNAGALDDPHELYCGPVRFVPDHGYAFISFPLTGTSWGNRGMNSAGLVTGISSQILPGLKGNDVIWNQDVAMRAILQTCATVEEVRRFCQTHSFTLNIVASDAKGGRLCIQNTIAGALELPESEYAVLTNHVACDRFYRFLTDRGVRQYPESPTTRNRRSRLIGLIEEQEGNAEFGNVLTFLASRLPDEMGSIWNSKTIVLTAACPMEDQNSLWLLYPTLNNRFEQVSILP